MSADNWDFCPSCDEQWQRDLAAKGAEVDRAYGKVSADEYEALKRRLKAFATARREQTFREDYEIGLHDGTFYVDYHGRCESCGFAHSFKHATKLEIAPAPDAVDPHAGDSSARPRATGSSGHPQTTGTHDE